MKAFLQFNYLVEDYMAAIGSSWYRVFYIWMAPVIIGIFTYRLERFFFLLLGSYYSFVRVPILPMLFLVRIISSLDINYRANIQGGMKVLHNSMGIVISGQSIIGKRVILVGGNVIGAKCRGKIVIGDNCSMGANAVIIGPIVLGDNISIGACACVVKNTPSNVILAGVPAQIIKRVDKDK